MTPLSCAGSHQATTGAGQDHLLAEPRFGVRGASRSTGSPGANASRASPWQEALGPESWWTRKLRGLRWPVGATWQLCFTPINSGLEDRLLPRQQGGRERQQAMVQMLAQLGDHAQTLHEETQLGE